jgi:hypothetical protein
VEKMWENFPLFPYFPAFINFRVWASGPADTETTYTPSDKPEPSHTHDETPAPISLFSHGTTT